MNAIPGFNQRRVKHLIVVWTALICGLLLFGCKMVVIEAPTPVQTENGDLVGTIILDPFVGEANSLVTVTGTDWPVESEILVTMNIGETEYTVANAVTDADGKFSASFIMPENQGLEAGQAVPILVTVKGNQESNDTAQAYLVVPSVSPSPTEITGDASGQTEAEATSTATPIIPTPTPLPTRTATVGPAPTPLATLRAASTRAPGPIFVPTPLRFRTQTPTPTPSIAPTPEYPVAVVAINALNVRRGPGTNYPIIGFVRTNEEYEIIGRYGGWWLISYPSLADDQGWVSGFYVEAENTRNVPIVFPPPTPVPTATATPVPTPTREMVCNPGEWSGCGGRPPAVSCFPDYVAQCGNEGQWGQCVWDPGFCWGTGGGGDDDDGDDGDGGDDDDEDDEDDTGGDDDDNDDDTGDDDDDAGDDDEPDDDDHDDDDDDT